MTQWELSGRDKGTGKIRTLVVKAADDVGAFERGKAEGIDVRSVTLFVHLIRLMQSFPANV